MVKEFSGWGVPQYWDEERHLSLEVKRRIVPDADDEVPWDMFILFGPEATWKTAGKHVLGWGEPVIRQAERLETLLSEILRKGEKRDDH